jgi:hypothetical protein
MTNFGRGGIILSKSVFVVSCERILKRAWYKINFMANNQLNDRIKALPKELRVFSVDDHCWHLHTKGLYEIIKSYKRSEKIKFEFGLEGRQDFLAQIKKIDELEVEKVNKVEALKMKNADALAFKAELELNYKNYEPELLSFMKEGIKFYPYQIVAAMFLRRVKSALLSMEMGLGKAEKLDSKLLTPNGWIRMGDVKLGHQIIGSDGKPHNVIGVFPQGIKDIYRVWFNDYTYTECCDAHLWAVNSSTRMWRTKMNINNYPNRILTLRQIMNEGLQFKNGNRKHYIPIVEPIEFQEKKLFIHPYLLGSILGDGAITEKDGIGFSTSDLESIDLIKEVLYSGNTIQKKISSKYDYSITSKTNKNEINRELKRLNLKGCNSYTKFIPDEYKFSSINQRLELLRGLLDTDGHVFKDGSHIEITLASKRLIEDLQFIIQSLGGIGRIKEKWIIYKGMRKMYYRMGVKLPPQFIPFKLLRKVERYKPVTKYLPNRAITKIEYVGKHEAQCIAVDSPDHLYLTDHCIVTHNTLCSIAYGEMMGFKKIFVITPNSLKFNFLDEVEKFTKGTKAHIINYKGNKYSLKESKYIIVNYDYFNSKKFEKVLTKFEALDLGFLECVICDESHLLKNTDANTYKNFKRIFKDIPCKVFLSGTPMPNRSKELYTVLNQISRLDFPTKKFFYETYCGMIQDKDVRGGWRYEEGLAKLEELFYKTAPYTYRKRKIDVLKDLPDKIYNRILIEMTPEQQATYNKIEEGVANEIFAQSQMSAINALTIMLRLRQYTSLLKIEPTIELVKRLLDEGEKSVVVDMFKPPLLKLSAMLGDVAVLHTGDQDEVERNAAKNDFQNPDGKYKVFLASIATTKYGLTLTAASKMFMMALPFSVGEYDQVSDRLHRIGQKDTVFIYPLIIKDSIDEYVFNMIERKRKEVTKVMDNEDYVSNVDDSVLSEILAILKKKYMK